MTLSTTCYKGTRDFYPEDKQRQNYIFAVWRQTVESFGYREYGTPLLEPLSLYLAKSGQELANEQTYVFRDRGNRQVTIRPEMTPSICRLVAARRQELAYPARFYSIANFMRYERPQKGRDREFWQLNLDLFGDDSIYADLEIIQIARQIMHNFKAKDDMYKILLNDRHLVDFIMTDYLNLDQKTARALCKLFDQKAKLAHDIYRQQLAAILQNRSLEESVLSLEQRLPAAITESAHFQRLQKLADLATKRGVKNLEIDIFLMRGLDYYTGMVLEVFDTHPSNRRAIFGGGRYDGLVSTFGAEAISAIGIAPGASTMWEFLTEHQLWPDFSNPVETMILITDPDDETVVELADHVASKLRSQNLVIEIDYSQHKLSKKLKSAAKKGIDRVIIIGSNEVKQQKLSTKNLSSGLSQSIELPDLKKFLKR